MSGLQIEVAGKFKKAKALRESGDLAVKTEKAYTRFTLSRLTDYELIVLE